MGLETPLYYIIETPVVGGEFKYIPPTYTNTISKTGVSHIYQSVIVTEEEFNVSNDIHVESTVTGIPTQSISSIASATPYNSYIISTTPLNIYGLSKEISNRIMTFTADLQLVNECNSYSTNGNAIPSICHDTFQGYTSNSSINTSQLPLYQHSVMNTTNRKKHLQQQAYDLNNLVIKYNQIIDTIKVASEEQYEQIKTQHDSNIRLRNELDQKLAEIYKYNDSRIMKSQFSLDRTIYTNILLTALATSMIYIVFSRL
jgi:hypothetical protein